MSPIIARYAGMMLMLAWWLTSTDTWSLALFALLFGAFYGGFVSPVVATMDWISRNSPYFLAQCMIMSRFEFNHPAVGG